MSIRRIVLVTTIVAAACIGSAQAQVQLLRHVIASGAVASASPQNLLVGTIGQTIIGRSASSSHVGFLGFWYTYPFPANPNAVREEYSPGINGASAAVRVYPNPVVDVATVTLALAVLIPRKLGNFIPPSDSSVTPKPMLNPKRFPSM